VNEIALLRFTSDDSTGMWYCLLLLSILLLIKFSDQRLFFSITRIGHTDIPSTKKIDAPSENIKIQDVIAFGFRGLAFGYFAFTLLAHWELIDAYTTPIYMVIGVWLGYTLVKFVLEMMIGLFWRSRQLLLEVVVRRGLLKTKATFLLLIFILISQYPPINNAIYWAIAWGIYLMYYIIGYLFFANPYRQLIRKKIVLFISYICTLEIVPLWVLFELINQTNA
jgi:hypothetical protein|tara:strand:+ start:1727 stop:2395 length:669 start_codon:yes stop_codon:yes gene_type:complete